jgi:hypothetical protein
MSKIKFFLPLLLLFSCSKPEPHIFTPVEVETIKSFSEKFGGGASYGTVNNVFENKYGLSIEIKNPTNLNPDSLPYYAEGIAINMMKVLTEKEKFQTLSVTFSNQTTTGMLGAGFDRTYTFNLE